MEMSFEFNDWPKIAVALIAGLLSFFWRELTGARKDAMQATRELTMRFEAHEDKDDDRHVAENRNLEGKMTDLERTLYQNFARNDAIEALENRFEKRLNSMESKIDTILTAVCRKP